jgi:hypothetical protein
MCSDFVSISMFLSTANQDESSRMFRDLASVPLVAVIECPVGLADFSSLQADLIPVLKCQLGLLACGLTIFCHLNQELNDFFKHMGVIIHWGHRFTRNDPDWFLRQPCNGKLILCDWKVGTVPSKRPFVLLDPIFPVACAILIATFRSTV